MVKSESKTKIVLIGNTAESLINFRGSLLRFLVHQGHEVFVISPECEDGQESTLNSFGVKIFQIPIERTGLNPFSDLKTIFFIYKILRQVKPDILISYALKPIFYGAAVAKILRIKHYPMLVGLGYTAGYTLSDKFSVKMKGTIIWPIISFFYKFSLSNARKILVYNEDITSLFLEKKLIESREKVVLVSGSGVDVDHFYEAGFPDKISFLLIARLLSDKGLNEYYDAAKIIKKTHPQIKFNLVGFIDENNPTAISKKQLDKWIDEGIINFLGKKEDVRSSLSDSSVYVLPSYHEGIPRSVLEAMSMGRPVITTDTYGCRETVKHNLNGFLVPIKDSKSLAKAMEEFIKNPSLIEKMGQESRRIAIERFSTFVINKIITETIEL